jgi:type IV secretory pathway TrbD component
LPDSNADGQERIEEWSAPLNGTSTTLEMTTSQTTDNPTTLTSRISTALGFLLVGWIAASGIFITWVVVARRRRALARRDD